MSELRDPPESDDFEWVNSWAGVTTPAAGDKPKQEPVVKSESAPSLAVQSASNEAVASAAPADPPETQKREAASQPRPDIDAPKPPVTTPANKAEVTTLASPRREPDTRRFVHPATRRFFAALRAPVGRTEAPAAPEAPAHTTVPQPAPREMSAPVPESRKEPITATAPETPSVVAPAVSATSRWVKVESEEASLVPEVSQLDRDIAEIVSARDALLDPAPFTISDPRKPRSPLAMLRNAESVPILVGSVVGATLLIVFGAAASLISLR